MRARHSLGRSEPYSQKDEMAFVEGLGSWAPDAEPTRDRQRRCLEGYVSSLEERIRWWPEFDEKALLTRAKEKLAGLRRGR